PKGSVSASLEIRGINRRVLFPQGLLDTGPAHLIGQTLGGQTLAPAAGPMASLMQILVAAEVEKSAAFRLGGHQITTTALTPAVSGTKKISGILQTTKDYDRGMGFVLLEMDPNLAGQVGVASATLRIWVNSIKYLGP